MKKKGAKKDLSLRVCPGQFGGCGCQPLREPLIGLDFGLLIRPAHDRSFIDGKVTEKPEQIVISGKLELIKTPSIMRKIVR